MNFKISEIAKAVGGKIEGNFSDSSVYSVSKDTRTLRKGDLYVALTGKNFNGHDFIADAVSQGAIAVLASQPVSTAVPIILVSDTLLALGKLAAAWRQKLPTKVIGLTGSSGKTSTKEILATCLSIAGGVHKTEGNLNNWIGLPLTILSCPIEAKFAIWEMGMNAPKEIEYMARIANPVMGLITNVGPAHLEGVGGTLEGVAKAKGELFEVLGPKAVAIINADDDFIPKMKTQAKKFAYGWSPDADLHCTKTEVEGQHTRVFVEISGQSINFKIPFIGEHFVKNFLAVAACCHVLGLSPVQIQEGISKSLPPKMRGEWVTLPHSIHVLNDTYNANPSSMEAALRGVALTYPNSRKIAVLGDMLELGAQASRYHQEVAGIVEELEFEALFALGNFAANYKAGFEGCKVYPASEVEKLKKDLKAFLKPNDVVVVKGSRGARMERIVESLKETI